MGVTCSVRLNDGACWKKVGQVACVLMGATTHREPLGRDGWHLMVDGFGYGRWEKTNNPSYIDVLVSGADDNPIVRSIADSDSIPYRMWYGLESRSLYPKAKAAQIALAEGITKFFGGRITYNDCTDKKRSFASPADFTKETNTSFYAFQNALESLKPLTQKDVDRCQKYAAY